MDHRDAERADLPALDRLDEDGVAAVHEASMDIVEHVGVKVDHERARRLFEASGADVDGNGVVTVPRDVVEDCVAAAPSEFTLHARNPEQDVSVGGDGPPVRAPGYGPATVRTYDEGRRPSRLSDYEALLKLAHSEDVVTCAGYNLCELNDVDRDRRHLTMMERALALTDKPVMGSTYGAERARECMELVGIAVDDPDLRKPYVAGLVNTAPPRSLDETMLGGLMAYAERGQPPVISSLTMAGASGPATLAASVAQANAENLMGITLAQLVNPGTPVVYGLPSSNVDVRYGSLSIGSPESALFVAVAGQLGRYYDLPTRGGGGLSDAKTVDYQSGMESMLVQALTAFSGIDFVLHAAGILESYSTISPEKFVLDCEALRYLDRFRRGFAVDRQSFAPHLLSDVEPAAHFLGEPHTEVHSEAEFYRSEVMDKRSHGGWADAGRKTAFELGRDRLASRLDEYRAPPMAPDTGRELAAYVADRGGAAD